MRVLVDVNVMLDVFLNREPWANESRQVWAIVTRDLTGFSASPVPVLSPRELIERLAAEPDDPGAEH